MKLKIGKYEITIKPGDYITFDGEQYKLASGDLRILLEVGNDFYCLLNLPNTTFERIPKKFLRKKQTNGNTEKWEFI